MKNFLSNKGTIALLFLSVLGIIIYYLLMVRFDPSVNFVVGVLKPMAVFSMTGLVLSSYFLFFSEQIFKSWLCKIAWWYMLVLLVITAATPVFSSNILSLDRSQVVFGGMILLMCITVPYTLIARRKIRTQV